MAALGLGTAAARAEGGAKRPPPRAAFVSHGAPSLALDPGRGRELAAWGAGLERPSALVVISAHWERTPATIGTARAQPLLHDYGGFAPQLRDVTYDAPAAAALADGLAAGLAELGVARDDERPWDHGVWVPLVHAFPARDVPILQVSLPSRAASAQLARLGARLRELSDERTLLLGSGGSCTTCGAWTGARRSRRRPERPTSRPGAAARWSAATSTRCSTGAPRRPRPSSRIRRPSTGCRCSSSPGPHRAPGASPSRASNTAA